jgi:hypothetical protein
MMCKVVGGGAKGRAREQNDAVSRACRAAPIRRSSEEKRDEEGHRLYSVQSEGVNGTLRKYGDLALAGDRERGRERKGLKGPEAVEERESGLWSWSESERQIHLGRAGGLDGPLDRCDWLTDAPNAASGYPRCTRPNLENCILTSTSHHHQRKTQEQEQE